MVGINQLCRGSRHPRLRGASPPWVGKGAVPPPPTADDIGEVLTRGKRLCDDCGTFDERRPWPRGWIARSVVRRHERQLRAHELPLLTGEPALGARGELLRLARLARGARDDERAPLPQLVVIDLGDR